MSVKSQVIKELTLNAQVNGVELSKKLNVSRNAVWKAVQDLKTDGYEIASDAKGYFLTDKIFPLSKESLECYLHNNVTAEVLKTVTSTNDYAKQNDINLNPPTVICSLEQTAGKGRKGRSFYSPKDDGVYFSITFSPKNFQNTNLITVMASIAVAKTLEELYNLSPKIKWVNDVYIANKKVCGILSEAVFDLESNCMNKVIVGIGINVKLTNIPTELAEIVTFIGKNFDKDIDKNVLVASVVNAFFELQNENGEDIINEYKRKSLILGKEIFVHKEDSKMLAVAMDINENGNLIVRYENGEIDVLNAGEVTTRLI